MEQRSIRVDRIGREGQPVVVIDGFAPDPARLVEAAAAATFRPMGEYYPGVRAPAPPDYFHGMDQMLATVAREVFGAHDRLSVTRALYSLTTTPPEALGLAQRIPHIDAVAEGMLAIIHYLSPDDQGGTAFYRHRSTGFETIAASDHHTYLDTLKADFHRLGEPPAEYISGDTPVFEQIARYDGVFNRALIYRSSLLHCARIPRDAALYDDPATGRLTVASFLSVT
ncbi:DUF6445 family protein [Brevundimonas sp. NPDC092305]|uniref:DUF6445 family protein n=1 Tax=Brevundimonas sp. NPDC092305 TaxID=3363957 RepID=UPI0037FEA803